MAWADIVSFVAGEIVNATRMNEIRNNLRELHGDNGAINLVNALRVVAAVNSQLRLRHSSGSINTHIGTTSNGIGIININESIDGGFDDPTMGSASIYLYGNSASGGTLALRTSPGPGVSHQPRVTIIPSGDVGVGTSAPRGRLHAAGLRGGWMHWSGELTDSTLDIVPDGVGDVVRGLTGQYVCHDVTTGVTTGGQLSLREPDNNGAQFGGIGAGIRILTDGTVRLYRTTTDTYHISLQLVWL